MEIQTTLFEVVNLLNDRPSERNPTHPDDGFYLSLICLLLGRTQNKNQTVPFPTNNGCNMTRHNLVENVLDSSWKKWQRNVLPQMCFYKKWRDTKEF